MKRPLAALLAKLEAAALVADRRSTRGPATRCGQPPWIVHRHSNAGTQCLAGAGGLSDDPLSPYFQGSGTVGRSVRVRNRGRSPCAIRSEYTAPLGPVHSRAKPRRDCDVDRRGLLCYYRRLNLPPVVIRPSVKTHMALVFPQKKAILRSLRGLLETQPDAVVDRSQLLGSVTQHGTQVVHGARIPECNADV